MQSSLLRSPPTHPTPGAQGKDKACSVSSCSGDGVNEDPIGFGSLDLQFLMSSQMQLTALEGCLKQLMLFTNVLREIYRK